MKVIYGVDNGFLDFPGQYSITLFFSGCNLRCSYCYNLEVVDGEPVIEFESLQSYLLGFQDVFKKKSIYVTLSGGEPTISPYFNMVVDFLKQNKFIIGMHTNGLVLPKMKNIFKSVILSVKTPSDNIPSKLIDIDSYCDRLLKSIDYYNKSPYKELRYVNILDQKEWVGDVLSRIGDRLDQSWLVKKVENFLGEKNES